MNWITKPEKVITFFGLLYLVVFCYLSYWAFDFIAHPRSNIPDPKQDPLFGWILAFYATTFLVAYISEIGILRIKAKTIFILACVAIPIFAIFRDGISGNIGRLFLLAWSIIAIIGLQRYFMPFEIHDEIKRQNNLQEETLREMRRSRDGDL